MAEQGIEQERPPTFTDQMRARFKGLLDTIAGGLNRIGLQPNQVTLLGLLGHTVAAIFLARGQMTVGGLVILVMAPLDALDGSMARLRGSPSAWGAFVDSVTDRYSELVALAGLMWYFLETGQLVYVMLVYAAAGGSLLVSYTRARGDSLGYDTKVGLLSRLERYLVLVPALVFNIPQIALWVLAVLTNLTALQRVLDVRSQARRHDSSH